jgi:hypothetical protein
MMTLKLWRLQLLLHWHGSIAETCSFLPLAAAFVARHIAEFPASTTLEDHSIRVPKNTTILAIAPSSWTHDCD